MSDLFSKQASLYSQYRPLYPSGLFEFLSNLCPEHNLAWDCATGNGQAAYGLSGHFKKVLATDLSKNQIEHSFQRDNVEYSSLRAEEKIDREDASVDLITVAQAIHWFDFDTFYQEVNRVLKPNGIIAAWSYAFHKFSDEDLNQKMEADLREFYFGTLGPYWKKNNKLIWDGYKDIPFPFEKIEAPNFQMKAEWNLHQMLSYFSTWSATQLFIDTEKSNPLISLEPALVKTWGDPSEKKTLYWDLYLLVGKNLYA